MDTVAGTINIGFHFGIPALCLMAKMNAGLKKFPHGNVGHFQFSFCVKPPHIRLPSRDSGHRAILQDMRVN